MARPKDLFSHLTQRSHNKDRCRRSRSWLERSERKSTENIERFIFLWISFEAAYGGQDAIEEFMQAETERRYSSGKLLFTRFLNKIIKLDYDKSLNKMFENELREIIGIFLENPCMSENFWKLIQAKNSNFNNWENEFQQENEIAIRAWKNRDLRKLLKILFYRLYTLRNQIVHGGTTYPFGVGERQIQHGSAVIGFLVPTILDIMESEIKKDKDSKIWGKVKYPRIDPELLSLSGVTGHEMP